ncbi:hypothetical protein LDENG_00259500, partial [Lucifuga dentata]
TFIHLHPCFLCILPLKDHTIHFAFFNLIFRGGTVVSDLLASQQEGPGFNSRPGQGLSVWSLYVVCVGSLQVLRLPPTSKDMHVR